MSPLPKRREHATLATRVPAVRERIPSWDADDNANIAVAAKQAHALMESLFSWARFQMDSATVELAAVDLAELADEFGVSRERVRQIAVRAFEKVQKAVKNRVAAIETPVHQPMH